MLQEVGWNIHMIAPEDGHVYPSSYCYYINDDIKTLIDTPIYPGFVEHLGNRKVDLILNTHFHEDHIGSNYMFPKAKIMAHPEDIPAMVSEDVFSEWYGIKNHPQKMELLELLQWHPSHIDDQFKHGDIIDLGTIKLEVIHTPGHTPGHCAFFWRKERILFSGDLDLSGFGPWYGNTVSNVDQIITSINDIISLRPRIILSGHKGIVDHDIETRLKKYLNKVYLNESNILNALIKPIKLEDLVKQKIIYGRWGKPEYAYFIFEKLSLLNHLHRLIRLGQVKEDNGWYYATPKEINYAK